MPYDKENSLIESIDKQCADCTDMPVKCRSCSLMGVYRNLVDKIGLESITYVPEHFPSYLAYTTLQEWKSMLDDALEVARNWYADVDSEWQGGVSVVDEYKQLLQALHIADAIITESKILK